MLKLFSNLFLKTPTKVKGGWMDDHALYTLESLAFYANSIMDSLVFEICMYTLVLTKHTYTLKYI